MKTNEVLSAAGRVVYYREELRTFLPILKENHSPISLVPFFSKILDLLRNFHSEKENLVILIEFLNEKKNLAKEKDRQRLENEIEALQWTMGEIKRVAIKISEFKKLLKCVSDDDAIIISDYEMLEKTAETCLLSEVKEKKTLFLETPWHDVFREDIKYIMGCLDNISTINMFNTRLN